MVNPQLLVPDAEYSPGTGLKVSPAGVPPPPPPPAAAPVFSAAMIAGRISR